MLGIYFTSAPPPPPGLRPSSLSNSQRSDRPTPSFSLLYSEWRFSPGPVSYFFAVSCSESFLFPLFPHVPSFLCLNRLFSIFFIPLPHFFDLPLVGIPSSDKEGTGVTPHSPFCPPHPASLTEPLGKLCSKCPFLATVGCFILRNFSSPSSSSLRSIFPYLSFFTQLRGSLCIE